SGSAKPSAVNVVSVTIKSFKHQNDGLDRRHARAWRLLPSSTHKLERTDVSMSVPPSSAMGARVVPGGKRGSYRLIGRECQPMRSDWWRVSLIEPPFLA